MRNVNRNYRHNTTICQTLYGNHLTFAELTSIIYAQGLVHRLERISYGQRKRDKIIYHAKCIST